MIGYPLATNALKNSSGSDAFDIVELNYKSESNRMFNEAGDVIHDIHRIVSPDALLVFKKNKQNMSVWDDHGDLVVLLYPEQRRDY